MGPKKVPITFQTVQIKLTLHFYPGSILRLINLSPHISKTILILSHRLIHKSALQRNPKIKKIRGFPMSCIRHFSLSFFFLSAKLISIGTSPFKSEFIQRRVRKLLFKMHKSSRLFMVIFHLIGGFPIAHTSRRPIGLLELELFLYFFDFVIDLFYRFI